MDYYMGRKLLPMMGVVLIHFLNFQAMSVVTLGDMRIASLTPLVEFDSH